MRNTPNSESARSQLSDLGHLTRPRAGWGGFRRSRPRPLGGGRGGGGIAGGANFQVEAAATVAGMTRGGQIPVGHWH